MLALAGENDRIVQDADGDLYGPVRRGCFFARGSAVYRYSIRLKAVV